jgi:hypothetical protein
MDIVGAFSCSHAGLIVTRSELGPEDQRLAVYDAFDRVRDRIADLRPDALVILATDHMKAYPLPLVPSFAIGVGPAAQGLGDGGVDPCTVPVHQPLARGILEHAVGQGVDLAFSEEPRIDHSFVVPLSLVTPGYELPIVPIAQNCNVPPRPTFARSRQVGQIVGDAIRATGAGRVVVLATGGLSHWVGSDERQAFMKRPPGERYADLANFPVEIEDVGQVNEEWDRTFLDYVCRGRLGAFAEEWTPEEVEAAAGNGAQEVRNWLTGAGIVRDAEAKVLAYAPIAEWLTGTAVVEHSL